MKRTDWKKVKCFYNGCEEFVIIPTFANERVYCQKHERQLNKAFVKLHDSLRPEFPKNDNH